MYLLSVTLYDSMPVRTNDLDAYNAPETLMKFP